MRTTIASALVVCALIIGSSCGDDPGKGSHAAGSGSGSAPEVVHVYTTRHYDADKDLFARFTKETGIEVKVQTSKAGALLKKLETEGADTKADLFITVDAGRLYQAAEKDLLQPTESEAIEAIVPAHLRDPKKRWFALTIRARVIVVDRASLSSTPPLTYAELADPKWKGKVLIRASSNIYNQSLMASIIAHEGEEKALAWAKGVVANFARKPKGNDRDQVKAIAARTGSVAVINTYYVGKLLNSKDQAERDAGNKIKVILPDQDGRGTHINISGAGVTRHAKNPEAARKLLAFLLTEDSQQTYADANYEYPVHAKVAPSQLLRDWGLDFKRDTLPIHKLGELNAKAREIFEKADWP